jgi:DNA-binding SARP family transcriptional activator
MGEDNRTAATHDRMATIAPVLVEQFPFGVIVFDRSRRTTAWNPLANALLDGRLEDADRPFTCCELFGCRQADSPLEGGCLTALALEADEPLPEIRIDLPGEESERGALWITGAALDYADGRVVVQVRPGERRDRRRRTDPHWLAGPQLRIRALSRTEVYSGEGSIGGRWLEQRPGQLLKFLVSQRHRAVHVDEIAYALWPDGRYGDLSKVRHYIHGLRQRLEPGRPSRAPSRFIVSSGGAYQLDRERVSVDADEFEALARQGLSAAAANDARRAYAHLRRAIALYHGDFLADEPYAEWALGERDRLRELAARTLHCLALLDRDRGDLQTAYQHLRQLAELEPLDTDVQRDLLALCLRRGRKTEAARRYAALRIRTMRDLGQEPDFRLSELADEVAAEA